MKFLEQQFVEQLTANIDPDNNLVRIGNIVFSPAQILQNFNKAAYVEAFEQWQTDIWLPDIIDKADEIISKYENQQRFNDLITAIKRDRVTPFIGSGMSNPSGFPLWKDFLQSLRERSTLTVEALEEILQTGDYEQAASEIKANMPDRLFDEQIEHRFIIREFGVIKGAIRYLPEIFKNNVITLNYDDLLETLYRSNEIAFNNNLSGSRIADFRRLNADGERCLVKFHGDLKEPRTRVLTKEEYEELYINNDRNKTSLIELFRNHKLLFLGCSLSQDRTIELFKEISSEDADVPRHIAFLRSPDENIRIEREHFLTERSIFPIWYDCESDNCHDECIQALLVKVLNELGVV